MPFLRLCFHLVWATKDRYPFVTPMLESALHRVIVTKAEQLGSHVFAIGGMEEHVHLVASLAAAISLSRFVGQIKGKSSHWAKRYVHGDRGFQWQSEYAALTLGTSQIPAIVHYVRNQRTRHQQGSTAQTLERCG